jgi:hypothetical protein
MILQIKCSPDYPSGIFKLFLNSLDTHKKPMTYDVADPGPGLGQAEIYLQPINYM